MQRSIQRTFDLQDVLSSEPECPAGAAPPPSTRGPVSRLSSWWRAALLSLACLALLAGLAALAAATAVYTINTPCSPGRVQCGNTGQCVRDVTWTSMLLDGNRTFAQHLRVNLHRYSCLSSQERPVL